MIDDADEDESGTINFPEFVGLMLKRQTSGLTKEDIKQVSQYISLTLGRFMNELIGPMGYIWVSANGYSGDWVPGPLPRTPNSNCKMAYVPVLTTPGPALSTSGLQF